MTPLIVLMMLVLSPEAERAKAKLEQVTQGKAKPGATVSLTARELEVYAAETLPSMLPKGGIRQPRFTIGQGSADLAAQVDFKLLRRSRGGQASWTDKLIEGERPVKATMALRSGNGWCAMDLKRLEISGLAASGKLLDFMLGTLLAAVYPKGKVNEPFRLEYNIDRIDLTPGMMHIVLKR